ncbi:helix-hairpin-helix domain-containing protein [Nocardioides cavernaquae]|uniref:helix-hairpin-helix domain-containing protein n=1 Tax=Nocardioides cavernaquae TaxID=2321396 RepID=UPI001C7D4005|nr:helix-hairpin-helix domain-containing protein [Nocardioides cavernaquae]
MGSRQDYDEALARRLALLRAELTGTLPPAKQVARDERPSQLDELLDGPPRESAREHTVEHPAPEEAGDAVGGVPLTTLPVPGRHASRRFAAPGWLPETALGPGPVAVVAVLLALGLAVTAWWVLRSRPEPVDAAVPVAAGIATPLAVPGTSVAPAPSAPAEVVVHVAGRVRRPGIVVLSPGARVIDALKAAGGSRPGVDLVGINLARPLVDGEQVLVGVGEPVPAVGSAGPAGAGSGVDAAGMVNLNTATPAELEELPGVGPVTAASIVTFREEHGSFTSVDELLDVSGIGEATLAEIAPHATV